MKQSFLKAVLLTTLITVSACDSEHTNNTKRVIDTGSIKANTQLSSEEKAERLALAAEELLTPDGFIYAPDVLDAALNYDSNNKRAQLYRTLMEQTLAVKGIVKRITPLLSKYPHLKKNHEAQIKMMENSTTLNAYLLDGPEDISTEEEVQAFLDGFYEKQENFRQFLIKNKDLEITLNYSSWLKEMSTHSPVTSCKVFKAPNDQYELINCDEHPRVSVKLNRADNEALHQIVAGTQITTILSTAYKINGLVDQLNSREVSKLSSKVISEQLLANNESAKLRTSNRFLNILSFGTDGIAAVQWAKSMQNTFCDQKHPSVPVREGMLFEKELCLKNAKKKNTIEKVAATVAAAIAGQHIVARSGIFETTLNPNILITQPAQDLKSIKPSFDVCDQLISTGDKSVAGLFVKKDVVPYLTSVNSYCGPANGKSNAQ